MPVAVAPAMTRSGGDGGGHARTVARRPSSVRGVRSEPSQHQSRRSQHARRHRRDPAGPRPRIRARSRRASGPTRKRRSRRSPWRCRRSSAASSSRRLPAPGLQQAVQQDHDGSILDDIAGYLQGTANLSPRTTDGEGILGHVLGGQQPQLQQALSSQTGLSCRDHPAPAVAGAHRHGHARTPGAHGRRRRRRRAR